MIRRLLLSACWLLLGSTTTLLAQTPDANGERVLTSRLTAVRVYLDRAALTEEASVTLPAGTHLLVFRGLPQALNPASITVRGTGGGVLQAVSPRVSYLNRSTRSTRLVVLEDSLERLADAVQALNDRQFVLQKEEEMLLKNNEVGGDESGTSPAAVAQLAELYRTRLTDIRKGMQEVRSLLKLAQQRRSRMQLEVRTLRAQADQPTQEVVVSYQAPAGGGRVNLVLDYLVGGAAWAPRYDLRVAATGAPIQLLMKADVLNNTGRDWSGVKLRLSTANPALGGTPPDPQPIYLDVYQPPVLSEARRDRAARKAAAAPAAADEAEFADDSDAFGDFGSDEEAVASTASLTTTVETGLAVEYDIALKYDIPADGKPHQVDVRQVQAPASYAYFTAPRLDETAFLRVSIAAWDTLGLLPGPAAVYFEGSFIAETQLAPATGDTLHVGLGRDARVAVQREQVRDFTKRQAIGSNIRESRAFRIAIRNTKREAVTVEVVDHVPVSRNAQIEVKPLELAGAAYEAGTGRLSWRLTLAPGETRRLQFSYEVKYPKDARVTGL